MNKQDNNFDNEHNTEWISTGIITVHSCLSQQPIVRWMANSFQKPNVILNQTQLWYYTNYTII